MASRLIQGAVVVAVVAAAGVALVNSRDQSPVRENGAMRSNPDAADAVAVYPQEPHEKLQNAAVQLAVRESAAPTKEPNEYPVGSEGYGPYVSKAYETGDPRLASSAAKWLRTCAGLKGAGPAIDELRNDPAVSAERFNGIYQAIHVIETRCQTVTPAQAALQPELDLLAMKQFPGHAASYLLAVGKRADPSRAPAIAEALARDAAAGDWESMYLAALYGETLGLPKRDIYVFRRAYLGLAGRFASVHALPVPDDGFRPGNETEEKELETKVVALIAVAQPRQGDGSR